MESVKGKVALVTGGSRGIGRATAERLVREGADVVICSRSHSALAAEEEIRKLGAQSGWQGRILGVSADISDPERVSFLFDQADQRFGKLDILVNNAGLAVFRKVGEMSTEDWHANIDLNLNGPFYCSREALKRFGGRGGFIVNISSLAGKNAFTGGAAYNASKAGLNLFGEAMMLDHRYDNVRVTSIMPGSVNTEFSSRPGKREGDTSWMIAPEDVAEAVMLALQMPERTTVSRIEIRPTKPKK